MANWNAEVEKLISREQVESQAKQAQLTQDRIARDNQIINERRQYYQEFITPGFQFLDKFHVPEKLAEIRDQILVGGEIIRIPTNYDNDIESYLHFFKKDHENSHLWEFRKRCDIPNAASYILKGPNEFVYREYDDHDGYSDKRIEDGFYLIRVSSNGSGISTICESFSLSEVVNINKSVKTPNYPSDYSQTEIEKLIQDELIGACFFVKQSRNYINSHQNLLEKYRSSHPKPRRSFLGWLFNQ